MLKDGEKFEPLGNGIQIIVSNEHKFWTDTVLLANFAKPKKSDNACDLGTNFAKPKKSDNACDLGTGCGAIPLIWCRNAPPKSITAVEIQENACDMLQRSLTLNNIQNINVINSDLRELDGKVQFSSYNLVVCNPPYKAEGTGIVNPNDAHKIARHEFSCTMQEIIQTASKLLNFSGRLCYVPTPRKIK